MSWNICIYAEARDKDDSTWHPVADGPVFDFYKSYVDDFYESLRVMKAKDCSIKSINSAKDPWTNADLNVKYCSLKDFIHHYYNKIDVFNAKIKSAYLALDLGISIDDYEIFVEEDFMECNEPKNDEHVIFDRLTNPVSKRLMIELANSIADAQRANKMIGVANCVLSMTNSNEDIRLIFVTE